MSNYIKLVNGVAVPMTEQEIAARQAEEVEWSATATERFNEEQKENRKAAYMTEADPLFFKWQAGEATQEEWQTKRNEIKARFPKE